MLVIKRPKVGVSVVITKDNKVLLGKRKAPYGKGEWAFPGGHLEFGEEVIDCVKREVIEEVGIKIKNSKFLSFTNDTGKKHYITLFFLAEYESGTISNCEPEKCEGWEWFSWDTLPAPLFLPIINLQKQKLSIF